MTKSICAVDGCERATKARGLCPMHYKRALRTGDPGEFQSRRQPVPRICSILGCERPGRAKGLCSMHLSRLSRLGEIGPAASTKDIDQRFWAKVDRRGEDECWPWIGGVRADGYGRVRFEGRSDFAHRVAYVLVVGPIPEECVLDHICHNGSGCSGGFSCLHRRCANPAHLEPVTGAENTARGLAGENKRRLTHCPKGHPYAGDNLYEPPSGGRMCRICMKDSDGRHRARKRAEREAGRK